ncbi:hypothetical protein [uncultured Victivallis sp.]|uniref:hypothetical protein n=1 Tax=uncultured Victivallis sp. TaxID=354118 RepID=UPI0025F94121|nr:hypothetical protein [uncultured Victivallis sp.]
MAKKSISTLAAILLGAALSAAPVGWESIDGAKLRDDAAGTFDLAIGGAEKGKSSDLLKMENVAIRVFGEPGHLSPGLLPGNHQRDGVWNMPKAGIQDGVPVAEITENYQPLLTVASDNGGISLPVATSRGAWIACKLYGGITFTLHPNGSGYQNITVGKKGEWSEEVRELPISVLKLSGDGLWRGYKGQEWNHANTLLQSYGSAKIAYIAILPATRIKLPAGSRTLEFTMLNKAGEKVPFSNPIPENASELAIVHLAPHASQLVWKLPDGWRGGRVIRNSLKENSLTIADQTLFLK